MPSTVWPTIVQAIQALFLPLLSGIGLGLAALITIQMARWKKSQERKDALADLERAKHDLVTMKDNSQTAVQAVEQLYSTAPPEVKASLALAWANHLNMAAHISTPSLTQPSVVTAVPGTQATQTILNEANVLPLPNKPPVGEG